jgi:hypothetical protein
VCDKLLHLLVVHKSLGKMLSGIEYISTKQNSDSDKSLDRRSSSSRDLSIADMVRQEKLDSISRRQQQKASEDLVNTKREYDEYSRDDDEDSSRKKRKNSSSQETYSLGSARVEKNCAFCIDFAGGKSIAYRNLIMSLGLKMYLTLPPESPLVEGECWIAPLEHHLSRLLLTSEHIDELYIFQRRIVRMFEAQKKGVIFIERVGNLEKKRHWMVQCIPIKRSLMDEAPIYFKKAILEADIEWSQNKKLIESHMTDNPVHKCIPQNFPYFSVQFNLGKGFVHPIEDERLFDWKFGKEVICAILDQPAQLLLRNNRGPEEESKQKLRASAFLKQWQPFDWTAQLDGGQY